MAKKRTKPLKQGERSRMIKARKDCIMKKVEELQSLTECGVCLIVELPDGTTETWPKNGGEEVHRVYERYAAKNCQKLQSNNNNNNNNNNNGGGGGDVNIINNVEAEQFCPPCVNNVNATAGRPISDDHHRHDEEVEKSIIINGSRGVVSQSQKEPDKVIFPEKELKSYYFPSDFDSQLEFLPDGLFSSSGIMAGGANISTMLHDYAHDQIFPYYNSVSDIGSSVSTIPSSYPPVTLTLPPANSVTSPPVSLQSTLTSTDQGNNNNNRLFDHQGNNNSNNNGLFHFNHLQDEAKYIRQSDLGYLPQFLNQYSENNYNYNMGGGWMNNTGKGNM